MSKSKKKYIKIIGAVVVVLGVLAVIPFFYNVEADEENIFQEKQVTTESRGESRDGATTPASDQPVLAYSGEFERIDYDVKGGFKIYEKDNKYFLRVEDLDITNGPDLYLIVSNKNPAWRNDDYQIIAKLKANKGSFNQEIPVDVDVAQFKYLIIHCRTFAHSFAGGEIVKL